MAQLYFKFGAMCSSKTANELMARFNYEERGQETLLVKPRLDTRDGDHMVYSRIGLKHPCIYFDEMREMSETELQTYALSACLSTSTSSSGEPMDWIRATLPTTCFTLLRCKWPMKCSGAPR